MNYLTTITNIVASEHLVFDDCVFGYANPNCVFVRRIDEPEKYVRLKPLAKEDPFVAFGICNKKIVTGTKEGYLVAHKVSDIINLTDSSIYSLQERQAGSLNINKSVRAHISEIKCIDTQEKLIVTGSTDKTAKIWAVKDFPKPLKVLTGHNGWVNQVVLRAQKDILVTGGEDKRVNIYGLESKSNTPLSSLKLDSEVHALNCSAESFQIYVHTANYLLVIDQRSSKVVQCYQSAIGEGHKLFPNERILYSCEIGKSIKQYDLTKGLIVAAEKKEEEHILDYWKCGKYLGSLQELTTSLYELSANS